MKQNLVVVESPAKSRTVQRILNNSSGNQNTPEAKFEILATSGHVYELEKKDGQVDVDNEFQMKYRISPQKTKFVSAIVDAMRNSDTLYLATDPDREGEAISAHILEILERRGALKDKPVHRIVFHEVTAHAIEEAMNSPSKVSVELVQAQQARAALDYLVGFNLSPLLWTKLAPGLSAGRVQSPALRLIVERQREINRFVPKEHWTIEAQLKADKPFTASLTHIAGKKLEKHEIDNEESASNIVAGISKAMHEEDSSRNHLRVMEINARNRSRRPPAPFTTSTLMQDATRRFGISARNLMRTAQELYEGLSVDGQQTGLITYMRTDSVTLSSTAVSQIRDFISKKHGANNLPDSPIMYRTKSKNAQEAHEAIRPTDVFLTPDRVKSQLNESQFKLYELIWKRSVACQMNSAIYDQVSVNLKTGDYLFHANGSTLKYAGFLTVYKDTQENKEEDKVLPRLEVDQLVPVDKLVPEQHFTQPPPRYNQASLVKTLEEYGIGRPSTYATIISKLLDRNYVVLESRNFAPTDRGCVVNDFLTEHFEKYVDYEFTAHLEDNLDEVARGKEKHINLLNRFWHDFKHEVTVKKETTTRFERVLGQHSDSGRDVIVRFKNDHFFIQVGRHSDNGDKPIFRNLKPDQDPYSITLDNVLEMLEMPSLPRTIEGMPDGYEVTVKDGRFGPYITVLTDKGKKVNISLGDNDPMKITSEEALELIKKKEVEDANRVIKDFGNGILVLNGRFGPYTTDGKTNVTIPKGKEPKELELAECQKMIEEKAANPNKKRFKRGPSKQSRARSSQV